MGEMDSAASRNSERIDLAAIPETRIGRLTLLPATRQIRRDDGEEEVVEPRVMQVLLALARADGGIVTRDQLTDSCWETRVVGEDAINRVISRLRRVSEGIGADSFKIETITKIGYRLIVTGSSGVAPPSPSAIAPASVPSKKISRRALILGGGSVALSGAVVFKVLHGPSRMPQAIPADVQRLLDQAEVTLAQDNSDSATAAIGLLQQVTEKHPDIAMGWAMLAKAYAFESHSGPTATADSMRQRGDEAAQHALSIDPTNAVAKLARVQLLPRVGNWGRIETVCRKILARDPSNIGALMVLERTMADVGRCRERAMVFDKMMPVASPTPDVLYRHVVALWTAGRLAEADRAMASAYEAAPRHYAVWFTRFYLLLYTGRIEQAMGQAQDIDGRPTGIPTQEFEDVMLVAKAMLHHDPALVTQAAARCMEKAAKGAGHAENAIQFLSALGKLDEAFTVANALYLNRGFIVSDLRFTREQGSHTRQGDRRTMALFYPSTRAMQRDQRFGVLVNDIGLTRYWHEAGVRPDYQIG